MSNIKYDKNNSSKVRRDNGSGTIVLRKDGRWMGTIQIGRKSDGSNNKLYVYGKTEAEAKRKLKQKISKYKANNEIVTSNISVKTWFTDWLNTTMKTSLKPKSFEAKSRSVNQFIIPNLGGMKVSEVTSKDIQKLVTKMDNDGYSYSQIRKVYDAIGQRYKKGIIDREVTINPNMGVALPQSKKYEEKEKIKFLSDIEIKKLINQLNYIYPNGVAMYPHKDFIILLLNTGLRIGEALALTWGDIDFENKHININKNVVCVKNTDNKKINPTTHKPYKTVMLVQKTLKTASSTRVIPMNKNANMALKNLEKINGKFKWVMANSKGNITDNSNINRMLKGALNQAGINTSYSVHSLRHTFATQLFKKGVDVKVVSKVLGHASVGITYDTYIHIIQEQEIKALNTLDTFDF